MAATLRDLGSLELWHASQARSLRRRESLRRRQRAARLSVPLVMAATAAGVGTPAFAAGSKHRASARAGARSVHPRILRLGMHGPDVARLQQALGVPVDGIFARGTLRAVRAFQQEHGLLVDGQVGPHTRAAMAAEQRGQAGDVVLRLHDQGPAVAELQRLLGIPDDGVFGSQTLRAVRRFQATHGLLVDGQVGSHTRAALHLTEPHGTPTHHHARSHTHRHHRVEGGLGSRAVALAMHEMGTPYVWGGESPSGFDCSGLVQWVYARLGVQLPRVAADQYGAGRHVSRSQLRPGDLVFFDGLGHVGIYAGGGRFIHSPHTGATVRMSALSGWYAENYAGATRVA
ncbi:MAG: C40 family peptidase [Gaiellales bacterium]